MSGAHDFGSDVSECVVVIMILICDVSGMCGGISQVCQGAKKRK